MIPPRMTIASAFREISVSEGRRLTVKAVLLSGVAFISLGPTSGQAQSLPENGTVVHGSVAIETPSAQSMTLTQDGSSAIVNWQSFNIGSDAHVDIRQPNASATMLNRVTGNTTSEIHGRLTANGTVHLVNPNGIIIGPNGVVNAGSFAASTLDISDEDFIAGRLRFSGNGLSATVDNAGRVSIGVDGYAALLGGRVRNSGVVTVPMGRIGFASGERVTLDLSGDQFLQVALPTGGEDGDEALIENSGLASAQGGVIEMRAATARQAVRHAVNLSGVAEARSVSVHNGTIILGGGAGGTVTVSGTASTASDATAEILETSLRPRTRPEITITGRDIDLADATLDASGDTGGGLIRVGGDFAGEGPLLRADTVTVDGASALRADSNRTGDGGHIVIWSDVDTYFGGLVSAQGGDESGDGGFIEVSSRLTLTYRGLADTRAANGSWGHTLLDPTDIVIDPGAGGETSLETSLNTSNFELNTSDVPGSEAGDITINADIDWAAATTLTLTADNDIFLNGAINAASGGLLVDAIGSITPNLDGDIAVNSFQLFNGDWFQVGSGSGIASFSATDFEILSGNSFTRALSGDGSGGSPFRLTDVFGLQGVATDFSDDSYILDGDINASGTSTWTNSFGTGFLPIFGFDGTFDGDGHEIQNLTVNSSSLFAGLFDDIGIEAIVRDLTITGANMSGVGGGILAGTNDGVISNVRVSGSLTTEGEETGGLVGANFGDINDSTSSATVTANISDDFFSHYIGGFVGLNAGTTNRSHATGNVSVTNTAPDAFISAGGFAGEEGSGSGPSNEFEGEFEGPSFTINDSYSRGNVSVSSSVGSGVIVNAGGFVGVIDGTVNRSYSTGTTTVSGDATTLEGGFTGTDLSSGGASGNFWDVNTSGRGSSDGATGLTTPQFQDTDNFIALGQAEGWNFATTWAPGDTGFYPVNYSTSSVIFAEPNNFTVQYGLTSSTGTTGTVSGGPTSFVFDQDGDTLNTSTLFDNLTYLVDENVGLRTFVIDSSPLTSADGVSYRVVDVSADATITQAPLTVEADDDTKTYGDVFTPTNFSVVGTLFNSDSVDSATLTSVLGSPATATVAGGPYTIAISNPTGTGISNYNITLEDGSLTVNPAPLTITALDQSKEEGESFAFSGNEFTTVGLRNLDSVGPVSLSSDGTSVEAEEGTFPIVFDSISGNGLANYTVTEVPGTFTVGLEDAVEPPPVVIVIGLPNPVDQIDPGGLGGIGGAGEMGVGFVGSVAARQEAAETFSKVDDISETLNQTARSCSTSGGDVGRYLACVSDALDDFSSELDAISTDLPPGMDNVAQIIDTARQQINDVSSRAAARLANATSEAERSVIRLEAAREAQAAMANAANEIRKSISLVRAEDPELASIQRATITTVAASIDNVGVQLSRVTDL